LKGAAMLQITIRTGNAAFAEAGEGAECARILREIAERIEGVEDIGGEDFPVMDHNGNRVGAVIVIGEGVHR